MVAPLCKAANSNSKSFHNLKGKGVVVHGKNLIKEGKKLLVRDFFGISSPQEESHEIKGSLMKTECTLNHLIPDPSGHSLNHPVSVCRDGNQWINHAKLVVFNTASNVEGQYAKSRKTERRKHNGRDNHHLYKINNARKPDLKPEVGMHINLLDSNAFGKKRNNIPTGKFVVNHVGISSALCIF
ncbi:conserved hypothetical protein [Ricinus communis]|uniref:Uncharacterized protein n=1 Tax=Ricinus communis TaxID=3988 RepID=B9SN19_RICCO|nr:conserved hypothetical protein [Ricinus communis]